jgi:hypothetical protein
VDFSSLNLGIETDENYPEPGPNFTPITDYTVEWSMLEGNKGFTAELNFDKEVEINGGVITISGISSIQRASGRRLL